MKVLPKITRNHTDKSITLSFQSPKYSIIWLHGLGGEAENYSGFWKYRKSALHNGCRVRLMQAPERWVTIKEDSCHSWYDLRSFNRFTEAPDKVFDMRQVQQSFNMVDKFVKEELQLWSKLTTSDLPPERRIYVGGMSQGGAMSLYYALSSPYLLGGAIALSSYLLPLTPLQNMGKIPLFLIHGDKDTTIHQKQARQSYNPLFLSQSQNVQYKRIPDLDHSVSIEEIGMIAEWMEVTHQLHEVSLMI